MASGSLPGPPGGSFVQITVVGVNTVVVGIESRGASAGFKAYEVTKHFGQLVLTQAKANASGRPGPRAPHGDFRRDLDMVMTQASGFITAHIGTNRPQGRRLEFGFVGEDVLGRHYNQPPYPYLGPALDKYADEYAAAVGAVV